jgi:Sporulation and spore germination
MSGFVRPNSSKPRGYQRRERLLARWRLSTVLAAVVALGAVAAVLAAGLSLGGFGVPTDSAPHAINPNDVPFGLLGHESPSTVITTVPHHSSQPEILWFIDSNGHLFATAVNIATPVSIASILDALMNGPITGNLQSQIPPGTQVLSVGVSNGLATIDLTSGIENASGEPLIQAIAQLVFTATPVSCPAPLKQPKSKGGSKPPSTTTTIPTTGNRLGVPPCTDRVLFEVDGQRLGVPIATGAQTARPITRADYSSLLS